MSERTKNLLGGGYNPDVLECLANLSNDEVFTPPKVANQMLDMLPPETWENPNLKFLDPACKTGVFLREIAKRLIDGLADEIPDLQERLDHIFQKQLYGIAITELTALASRRSLYCSKYANGKYSVTKFDNPDGNIRFVPVNHTWEGDRCKYCGASRAQYQRDGGLETHAYEFIHTNNPEEIFNMKFDVIIGNPPYQMSDGGNGSSAKPIYQHFINNSVSMSPDYFSMIIPARWYAGGKGLDEFRDKMLKDDHIAKIVDYFNPDDCFPGVDISGGVMYFLWSKKYSGDCEIEEHICDEVSVSKRPLLEDGEDTFIRFNKGISIYRKIVEKGERRFSEIVSSRKPFGFDTKVSVKPNKGADDVYIYAYPKNGYVNKSDIKVGIRNIEKYKIFTAKAYGERGDFPYLVIGKPFVGKPGECCSETYLLVGGFETEDEANNVKSYMQTRFFRYLVLFKKNTQNAARNVYNFVPIQDFSKKWTDDELCEKYGLSDEERAHIEKMVRPMEDK